MGGGGRRSDIVATSERAEQHRGLQCTYRLQGTIAYTETGCSVADLASVLKIDTVYISMIVDVNTLLTLVKHELSRKTAHIQPISNATARTRDKVEAARRDPSSCRPIPARDVHNANSYCG